LFPNEVIRWEQNLMAPHLARRKGEDGGRVVKTSVGVASVPPHELEDVRLISAKETRRVLGGISDMQLWRMIHHPELGFPQPIKLTDMVAAGKKPRIVSTRNFFRYREIVRWIERREAANEAA
jgi:predicted DNA-binding transcriptional regulator AlpA